MSGPQNQEPDVQQAELISEVQVNQSRDALRRDRNHQQQSSQSERNECHPDARQRIGIEQLRVSNVESDRCLYP